MSERGKLCQLTKWEDGDQPESYLLSFEDTMKQAGVPQQEWPQRLRPLLTGRALTAYSRDVPEDAKESYSEFKEALLRVLGLSVKQCRLDIWNLRKKQKERYQETACKIAFMTNRMLLRVSLHSGCHAIFIQGSYSMSSRGCQLCSTKFSNVNSGGC